MLSFLAWLFCCVRAEPLDDHVVRTEAAPIVDERTPLIEPQPLSPTDFGDQDLNDRLDTIVRAKAGKMLNVGPRVHRMSPTQSQGSLTSGTQNPGKYDGSPSPAPSATLSVGDSQRRYPSVESLKSRSSPGTNSDVHTPPLDADQTSMQPQLHADSEAIAFEW
ncbi:hypothetical protein DFH06DRAFT_1220548 [Mycena polygramma]|nr:hypothetical protein DFH06DRAFT_1237100 [Mycena polygramma]KAJ7635833.1 hypothetical protein DFH06DRAFT_1220548 [Mycena polygramma]